MLVHRLRDRRGYSLTWAAAFRAILFVPLSGCTLTSGRWEHARWELYKAADLAALAACYRRGCRGWSSAGVVKVLEEADVDLRQSQE